MNKKTKKQESQESYMHRYAKEVLVNWLRYTAAIAEHNHETCATFGDIEWEISRSSPTWGIYQEYPISPKVISDGKVIAWDTLDWESKAEPNLTGMPWEADRIQTPNPPCKLALTLGLGEMPSRIIDVAVLNGEHIKYALEIYYKHPLKEQKIKDLIGLGIRVFEIKAEDILSHCHRPTPKQGVLFWEYKFENGKLSFTLPQT